MENDAVKVYEGADLVEEDAKATEKPNPRVHADQLDHVDERSKKENTTTTNHRSASCCCCCFSQGENFPEDLQPAGTTAQFQFENNLSTACSSKGVLFGIRSFLDSTAYYIFVIILTFAITIFLFVELFIDSGLLVGKSGTEKEQSQEMANISLALHWFSFAILSLFFIEIVLRIVAWRMRLIKDLVSIFDCIIVFIAFVSNICIALVAGAQSPIDAISLVIILRLVRIYSLVKVRVRVIKKQSRHQIKEAEMELINANSTISSLRRQIMDKDFEIKQLHAFLGSGIPSDDHRIREAIKASEEYKAKVQGATADTDLQRAIALSKETFDKESGSGVVNKAFAQADDAEDGYDVLVHSGPEKARRPSSDMESGFQLTTSLVEEYFKASKNTLLPGEDLPEGTSPGARRKNKLPVRDISKNTNNSNGVIPHTYDQNVLEVLKNDVPPHKPITVCIDPRMLLCDENKDQSVGDAADGQPTDSSANHSNLSTAPEETKNIPCHFKNLRYSDIGSSDGYGTDTTNQITKSPLSTWMKNSGSSLGSESGYQSEELTHNSNGKSKLTLCNAATTDNNMLISKLDDTTEQTCM